MTDVRINTGALRNPKLRKVRRRLGRNALWAWVALLMFAAESRPNGRLYGLDEIDLAIALDLDDTEDPEPYVEALLAVGLLERDSDGVLEIHDWSDWNSWAANAPQRQLASRIANHKKALKFGRTVCDRSTCEFCNAGTSTQPVTEAVSEPVTEAETDSPKTGLLPSFPLLTEPSGVQTTPGNVIQLKRPRKRSKKQVEIDSILTEIEERRPGTKETANRAAWEDLVNEYGCKGVRLAAAAVTDWETVESPIGYLRSICNSRLDRGRRAADETPQPRWS